MPNSAAHTHQLKLLALPERVFQHSEAEAVLLLCSGLHQGTVQLRTREVYQRDLEDFYSVHQSSYDAERLVEDARTVFADSMWQPPLEEVWQATEGMSRLGDFASVHRGIEYNVPFTENEARLVSHENRPGFTAGVHTVQDTVEPFVIARSVFLNADLNLMRTFAYKFPWNEPKLIVNASRQSRGPWNISASIDYRGLVCYRNFHGIWPTGELPLEVLAAVLNSPVANAFISARGGNRYIRARSLKAIPIPVFGESQQQRISSLVGQYTQARQSWLLEETLTNEEQHPCLTLMRLIDAEVLKAYDLEPRIERMLLDYFNGHQRLGPIKFIQYFPPTFRPFIPWHRYLSEEFEEAGAKDTLQRLPVIPESPLISEALSYLE